ncbi:MAG: lamin tail domain-containing protein [Armatimonadetes bacterium]|nr:lamin tail domain-containing protein [Armatimonadota bacterium]
MFARMLYMGAFAAGAVFSLVPCAGASVVIDEVVPLGASLGRSATGASVKLYNSGPSDVALGGWTILQGKPSGAPLSYAVPPAVSLQSHHYAIVHFSGGTDDLDASDGVIDLYSGSGSVFAAEDEVGLYTSAAITPANLADFISWSQTGGYSGGAVESDAVAAGKWTSGDFVDISTLQAGASIARLPSGYDSDSPKDWGFLDYGPRASQISSINQNPVQLEPLDATAFENNLVSFSFDGPAWAEQYNLQVDDDPTFSTPEINQVFSPPSQPGPQSGVNSGLAPGVYYWRVRVKPSGQPYLEEAAVWTFAIMSTPPPAPSSGDVKLAATGILYYGVGLRLQHRDSQLVCIWDQDAFGGGAPSNQNGRGRPGCDPFRFAGQAWDAAHPQTAAHVGTCGHCAFYCARGCTQMLNHFFGGDLFQDRISYHIRNGDLPGPEGDLGHDRGFSDAEVTTAVTWALTLGGGVTYNPYFGAAKASFAQFQARLANGPMICGVPNHVVVCDGWYEIDLGQNAPPLQMVHILDPWPGNPSGWVLFDNWVARNDATWALPAGAKVGRKNEASVTTDSDGDGLMDFDEQNPRPFCSLHNDPDTDKDEVPDKREIEAYTFHEERDHAGHDNDAAPPGFADVDGDGLRSECDCDSDNDSDFDGGEDIDGDGDGGMGGWPETDMFGPPHELKVFTDKKIYRIGEDVQLTGWDFHKTSTYPYDIIPGCPDLVDNQGLGQAGTVTTNDYGRFPWTTIFKCTSPGKYLAVVDVLKDHLYSEPDNWDPWTCFECIQPCIPTTGPDDPCTPRDSAPGVPVIVNLAVVTGTDYVSHQPALYVQDPNGRCALRIETSQMYPVGTLVCLQGVVLPGGYEPTVLAQMIIPYPASVEIAPTNLNIRAIGGAPLPSTQPMVYPYGANNTCTLVRTVAKVIGILPGQGVVIGDSDIPVRVNMGPFAELMHFSEGDVLAVTGISTATETGGRALTIRGPEDIQNVGGTLPEL